MFGDALRRFVLVVAFIAALASLVINLMLKRELLYSAFIACCVMLVVSIVLFLAAHGVAKVLMVFLFEQKKRAREEAMKKQLKE